MPHATANGDKMPNLTGSSEPTPSKFLNHLSSYPVVSDGIEKFQQNPYGKKSIEVGSAAYDRFGKPLEPYFDTPIQYVKPYAGKVDEMAVSGLEKVEQRFPIMKEDSEKVWEQSKGMVWWPVEYAQGTWDDEHTKVAKQHKDWPGLVVLFISLISFELRLVKDAYTTLISFLGPRYEESKKKGSDYVRISQEKFDDYKNQGFETYEDYKKFAEEKYGEYANKGQEKSDELSSKGQKKANEAKDQAYATANDVKGQAEETRKKGEQSVEQGKEKAKQQGGK